MEESTLLSLLRLVLLWMATITYHQAGYVPAARSKLGSGTASPPRRDTSQGVDSKTIKNKYGEPITNDDVVHDNPKSVLFRMSSFRNHARAFMWFMICIETLMTVLVIQKPSSSALRLICPIPAIRPPPSWSMFFLVAVMRYGLYIRRACFDALGKMFTFAHTTRSDHTLVTWGPYAYARHASYTALGMVYWGANLVSFLQGGWLRECGFLPGMDIVPNGEAVLLWWILRLTAWAWAFYNFVIIILLMLRAPKEDATLKARFGKEWESYKRIVPWMFVPYIF